jgi:hypothetical protein
VRVALLSLSTGTQVLLSHATNFVLVFTAFLQWRTEMWDVWEEHPVYSLHTTKACPIGSMLTWVIMVKHKMTDYNMSGNSSTTRLTVINLNSNGLQTFFDPLHEWLSLNTIYRVHNTKLKLIVSKLQERNVTARLTIWCYIQYETSFLQTILITELIQRTL